MAEKIYTSAINLGDTRYDIWADMANSAIYDASGNNIAETLASKINIPATASWESSAIYGLKQDGTWNKYSVDYTYTDITEDNEITVTSAVKNVIDNGVTGINNGTLGQPLALMTVSSDDEITAYCEAGCPVGTLFFRITNS